MSLSTSTLEWFLAFIKGRIHVVINMEGLERSATPYEADSDPTASPPTLLHPVR